jgi:hypothetical protein
MENYYFLRKIKVYITLDEEKHIYMPYITIREHTHQKILFFGESRGAKGNYCLEVGHKKAK